MRESKGVCLCAFMERYPIGMVETKRRILRLLKKQRIVDHVRCENVFVASSSESQLQSSLPPLHLYLIHS